MSYKPRVCPCVRVLMEDQRYCLILSVSVTRDMNSHMISLEIAHTLILQRASGCLCKSQISFLGFSTCYEILLDGNPDALFWPTTNWGWYFADKCIFTFIVLSLHLSLHLFILVFYIYYFSSTFRNVYYFVSTFRLFIYYNFYKFYLFFIFISHFYFLFVFVLLLTFILNPHLSLHLLF